MDNSTYFCIALCVKRFILVDRLNKEPNVMKATTKYAYDSVESLYQIALETVSADNYWDLASVTPEECNRQELIELIQCRGDERKEESLREKWESEAKS